ncbi:MAG: hypothetical protein IKX86_04140 [Clostridia bacterium]|nr:hypothetical protein [Clostridia bacterium]
MKKDMIEAIRPTCVLVVRACGKTFYASLENNPSARAFIEKLSPACIIVCASDLDGAGKAGALPWDLPQCDGVTAAPGDVMLVDGDRIGVFHGESPRRFTRLAKIGSASEQVLSAALGDCASLSFHLEWSE